MLDKTTAPSNPNPITLTLTATLTLPLSLILTLTLTRTLPRDSPVSYLLKYVELCRVHWYDATTQYRTLFASDDAGEGLG